MPTVLIDPEEIPTLDEVHFEDLEAAIREMREAAGSLRRHGAEIDAEWAANIALNYLAPNGQALAEKMIPVKQNAGRLAEAGTATADALQGYANEGIPLKVALKGLKRDAGALVAKVNGVTATGMRWEDQPELVEENERLRARLRQHVTAHEEARQNAASRINATNNGPGASTPEQLSDYLGMMNYPLFALGSLSAEMIFHRYGRFAPTGAKGRFVSVKNATLWENTWRRLSSKNWIAKPYASTARAKWLKAGTWGTRAGGIVAAGTAGLDQWDKDSQNAAMSTEKRVARTGVKAAGAGGGAIAGAKIGAAAGGAVGAAFGGVGAPVGAVVGGLVGAAVGSGVGSSVADGFNKYVIGNEE